MSCPVLAAAADVKVRACSAPIPCPWLDLNLTEAAVGGDSGCIGVVQVVEDHHAAVLGPSDGVKLVMIGPLAEIQEGLQKGRS